MNGFGDRAGYPQIELHCNCSASRMNKRCMPAPPEAVARGGRKLPPPG